MENILEQVNVFNAKELAEFLTGMNDRIRALEIQVSLLDDVALGDDPNSRPLFPPTPED